MPINIQDYLLGRIPVGRKFDIPAYLMAKAASGGRIQEITGTLPLTVRSRASQILKNYRIYGTESGAGVETENGYKLPITVTSNGTTTDYPVYIGDSQLMAEEYVDYVEQKVYRCYGELTLRGNEGNLYYYGEYNGVQTFYVELPDNEVWVGDTPFLSCNYYATTYIVEQTTNKTCRYRQSIEGGKYYWRLGRIYIFDNDYTNLTDFKAHLAELYNNGAPLKISYLLKDAPVPTDPPVPLPDISLPQGEVTIDTEEELKPQATIEGKIKQIT